MRCSGFNFLARRLAAGEIHCYTSGEKLQTPADGWPRCSLGTSLILEGEGVWRKGGIIGKDRKGEVKDAAALCRVIMLSRLTTEHVGGGGERERENEKQWGISFS